MRWPLLLLLLLAPTLPAGADDDGESEIEINEAPPEPEEKDKVPLHERINTAIERGVVWLKKAQKSDGSWGPVVGNKEYGVAEAGPDRDSHVTGPTSFALFTLAKCGVDKRDPVVIKGMTWLKARAKDPGSLDSYEAASLVLCLEATHERSRKLRGRQKERKLKNGTTSAKPAGSKFTTHDWRWMNRMVKRLVVGNSDSTQNPGGGWRYHTANGDQDVSATQFALLGLRAASQAGYPVPVRAYVDALKFIQTMQAENGAFGYRKGEPPNYGMTAAGVASIIICCEQIRLSGKQPPAWTEGAIERGLAYLDRVFSPDRSSARYHFYYLYGIERIGDLLGRREFGGKDWYTRGARYLIGRQDKDGKWVDSSSLRPKDVLGTCFALLFLKRGTAPAVTVSER
jgi:hypothetical protein